MAIYFDEVDTVNSVMEKMPKPILIGNVQNTPLHVSSVAGSLEISL